MKEIVIVSICVVAFMGVVATGFLLVDALTNRRKRER